MRATTCFSLIWIVLLLLCGLSVSGEESPELSISSADIAFSKLNPINNENITIYGIVHNEGKAAATATMKFYEDSVADQNLIGIDETVASAGETSVATVNWTVTIGVHQIFVVIDPVALESNLENNIANTTIDIYDGKEPLLQISGGEITITEETARTVPIDILSSSQVISNVHIQVLHDDCVEVSMVTPEQEIQPYEKARFYLEIKAPKLTNKDMERRRIIVQAEGLNLSSNAAELKLIIHPSVENTGWWAATVATTTVSAVGVLAVVFKTEFGRFGFLKLIFVPLYSRIKKEKVLDHFVRGQIYEYIRLNPGDHYSSIKESIGIKDGVLAYHLQRLEREGFIKSSRDGIFKRFYSNDVRIPQEEGVKLSEIQMRIVDSVRKKPGLTVKEISSFLEVSRQVVGYNIKQLTQSGLIRENKKGRKVHCYVTESL